MIGQSVRFLEASRVLKKAVREKTYGEILHGHFARIGGMAGPVPAERAWFVTQSLSGGAVMDLHIHDADLIVHLLGRPSAVQAFGAINHLRPDSGPDHMYMRYFFGEDRPFITAEAGWMRLPGTRFDGAFEVDFDRAMLLNLEGKLMLYRGEEKGGPAEVVEEFPADLPGDIWEYFVGRLEAGEQPTWCPPEDSAFAVKMANAVVAAVKSGEVVPLS